jgi:hypothetical protein
LNLEEFIEPDIREEMKASIEKREQSEHAAEPDKAGSSQGNTRGCNGQRDEQESQGPVAGRMGNELDRVGSQAFMRPAPSQSDDWQKANQKNNDLQPPD